VLILCISFYVSIIVCPFVHLVVFVVCFVFCRSFFSTLILLVGSFDRSVKTVSHITYTVLAGT